ncbi:hypothetical protein LCGC14_0700440 [marine sediment metagenome]|uniref:Uncharacterized protein n=1 Tax=marine sediment metagenome TaxID=412755 RepID=A0A0F9TQN6_9ZZZZ
MSLINSDERFFYGRGRELAKLIEHWQLVKDKKQPCWVNIIAESGSGKTRIVQEFYKSIIKMDDELGYWPDYLPQINEQLEINPKLEEFADKQPEQLSEIPWLWWGIKGLNTGMREGQANNYAADVARRYLDPHLASYLYRSIAISAGKSTFKDLRNIAMNILTVGWWDAILFMSDRSKDAKKMQEASELLKLDILSRSKKRQTDIQESLLEGLYQIISEKEIHQLITDKVTKNHNIASLPLILVLDDVQWFDQESRTLIARLIEKVGNQKLPLMIISTTWTKEWQEGCDSLKSTYDGFQGEKCEINLSGFDGNEAASFIRARKPNLCVNDIQMIKDRANGNYRHITELMNAIERDERCINDEGELSQFGLKQLNKNTSLEHLIAERYYDLRAEIRSAVEISSEQGPRFDVEKTVIVKNILSDTPEKEHNEILVFKAINDAENPGSIISTITLNETESALKEFIHGPYFKVINDLYLEDEERSLKVKNAYHSILIEKICSQNDLEFATKIFLETNDIEKKLHLSLVILQYLVENNQYFKALSYIKKIAEISTEILFRDHYKDNLESHPIEKYVESFGWPDNHYLQSISALKVINYYGYLLAKEMSISENGAQILGMIIGLKLDSELEDYIENGDTSKDIPLSQLIDACRLLILYKDTIGETKTRIKYRSYMEKLLVLRLEEQYQFDKCDEDLFELVNVVHEKAELEIKFAYSKAKRKAIYDELRNFDEWLNKNIVKFCDKKYYDIILARQIVTTLIITPVVVVDYSIMEANKRNIFERAADKLGDILYCLDEVDDEKVAHCFMNEIALGSPELAKQLLFAAKVVLEESLLSNYSIATLFLDRLFRVSNALFEQLEDNAYFDTHFMRVLMELWLALFERYKRNYQTKTKKNSESNYIHEGSRFEFYLLVDRVVSHEEVMNMLPRIAKIGQNIYEHNRGNIEVMVSYARFNVMELDDMQGLRNNDVRERALGYFTRIIEDARLTNDPRRITRTNMPVFLEWIIKLYHLFLKESDTDKELWNQVTDLYKKDLTNQLKRHGYMSS